MDTPTVTGCKHPSILLAGKPYGIALRQIMCMAASATDVTEIDISPTEGTAIVGGCAG